MLGLDLSSVCSPAWSFPHNPARSLSLGGSGLCVCDWVIWLGLGKPSVRCLGPFPAPCLLTNPAYPLFIRCMLYIYCHLSQNWGGAAGAVGYRCSRSALSGSSSGVVPSQGQAAANLARSVLTEVWHSSDAEQRADLSLSPWDAEDAWACSWLAVGVGMCWRGSPREPMEHPYRALGPG